MSGTSVNSAKAQLATLLGSNGLPYWRSLSDFLAGKTSRKEFERDVRQWLNTSELVQLHNDLLVSMIVSSRLDSSVDAAGSASSSGPPRKRRRMLLPHQDPQPRLRKWITGLKRAERERVRGIAATGSVIADEMRLERPIMLRTEGKNAAGTRVPVQLSSASRTLPGAQNLAERISLIASQNNLTATKPVATLASAAIESYLKQLAMDALSLTSSLAQQTAAQSSHPLQASSSTTLSLSSFSALLTVVPSSQPGPSAAVDKLFVRGTLPDKPDETRKFVEDAVNMGLERELAQYWGLLSMRSGVREYLEGA